MGAVGHGQKGLGVGETHDDAGEVDHVSGASNHVLNAIEGIGHEAVHGLADHGDLLSRLHLHLAGQSISDEHLARFERRVQAREQAVLPGFHFGLHAHDHGDEGLLLGRHQDRTVDPGRDRLDLGIGRHGLEQGIDVLQHQIQGPFVAPVGIVDLHVSDHGTGDGRLDVVRIAVHQAAGGQQRELPHGNGQQGKTRPLLTSSQIPPGDLQRTAHQRRLSKWDRLKKCSGTSTSKSMAV